MTDYVSQLEAELIRAGRRRQRGPVLLGRRIHAPLAGLMTGLGALVAVGVAVLALVLIGHSRTSSPGAVQSKVPSAAQGLVSALAVLRRPQEAGDRTLPAQLVRKLLAPTDGKGALVPSLTRLVATLPNDPTALGGERLPVPPIRIFLIVTTPGSSPAASREPGNQHGDLVSIAWAVGSRFSGFGKGVPALFLHSVQVMRPTLADTYNVSIAPDGVARARWSFVDGTIRPAVQNNIAVGPSVRRVGPANGNSIKVFMATSLTGVTWYGANGQTIASYGTSTGHPFGASRPIAQLTLTSPAGVKSSARGVAEVLVSGARRGIEITAEGLPPNARSTAYAVWLYGPPSASRILGFVYPRIGSDGRLHAVGALPPDTNRYREILITLEHRTNPKVPGMVVLEGRLTLG